VPGHSAVLQHTPTKEVTPVRYEQAVTALEQYLMLKRYSWRTIMVYKNCFRQFIWHYDDFKPSQLTRKQIDAYVAGLIKEKVISESHQNQILSAIKMFYLGGGPRREGSEYHTAEAAAEITACIDGAGSSVIASCHIQLETSVYFNDDLCRRLAFGRGAKLANRRPPARVEENICSCR
jgi:hypothetical protein